MASTKGVFGNLKSKLGFGDAQDDYDAQDEYDEYDEYAEYEEYDDAESTSSYSGYDDYDPYADSTAPRSFGNRNTVTTRNVRGTSHARLVSSQDVRDSARSVASAAANTAPLTPARRASSRTMVDSSLPPTMTPEGTAAMSAASNRRSSGLDSLFSSTAEEAPREEVSASDSRANRAFSAGTVAGERATSAMVNATTAFGHRQLQVIRPLSYNDAEAVVRALKAGEVAVLNMNGVDSALAKRILDFAFGAACALGANVETPAKGVYAVAIGAALSESEKSDLSGRGVF